MTDKIKQTTADIAFGNWNYDDSLIRRTGGINVAKMGTVGAVGTVGTVGPAENKAEVAFEFLRKFFARNCVDSRDWIHGFYIGSSIR